MEIDFILEETFLADELFKKHVTTKGPSRFVPKLCACEQYTARNHIAVLFAGISPNNHRIGGLDGRYRNVLSNLKNFYIVTYSLNPADNDALSARSVNMQPELQKAKMILRWEDLQGNKISDLLNRIEESQSRSSLTLQTSKGGLQNSPVATLFGVLVVLVLLGYLFFGPSLPDKLPNPFCLSCESKPNLQQMLQDKMKQVEEYKKTSELLVDHKTKCQHLVCTSQSRAQLDYFAEICNPEHLTALHPLIPQLTIDLELKQSNLQLSCNSMVMELSDLKTVNKFREMVNMAEDLSVRIADHLITMHRQQKDLEQEVTDCMKCHSNRFTFS